MCQCRGRCNSDSSGGDVVTTVVVCGCSRCDNDNESDSDEGENGNNDAGSDLIYGDAPDDGK